MQFPPQFLVRGPGFLTPHTDLPVAGCAQGLQVLQGALSSSTVHGLDVIHLPELPLRRAPDHLVQLQHTKDRAGVRHSSTTWTSAVGTRKLWEVALYSFHQDKVSQTWHFLVTPTGQATTVSSWKVFTQPWLYMHLPTESQLWCFLEVLEDNGI